MAKKITTATYDHWIEAKAKLDYYKNIEFELRTQITNHFLEGTSAGTHNFNDRGYALKCVNVVNTSIDEDELSLIWDELSEEEEACIKMKPSLIMKNYKELENRSTLDQVIITKPGAPRLSIEKANV